MTIRRAVTADAAALAMLAEQTFRETFAADTTDADMAEHCARSYSTAIQTQELASDDIQTLVCADVEGRLVAFAQLRSGATSEVTGPAPIELWRFYVDRVHHGKGVAQDLMSQVFDAARERESKTLWLGVWERNWRAQAFYRKAGFIDVGAHEFRVGQDAQTDRLMARSLER